jgi:DNA-binding SARP family transcriptional activator
MFRITSSRGVNTFMSAKVTYRQQFTRCGKQRCHKCRQGAGHGPYWYAYWSVNGRTVSKYLGKDLPEDVEIEIETRAQQQSHALADDAERSASPPALQHNVQKDILVEAPLPARNFANSSMEGSSDKHPVLRIYLLGRFRIESRHGKEWQTIASSMWQRRRARALLGCLLSNAGRRLAREQAMKVLWPDLDMETAANRINGAVHEVRRILEPGLARPSASRMLRLERGVLQLADAELIWVDADIFEGLLNNAHEASDMVQAEHILEEAAQLYGGDYLLEELYAEWATMRRESLRLDWIGLLLNLAELRSSRGALVSAIEPLDRLLATDPTHETAVRRMMLLLTRLDRRGEALHVYHRLVSNLQREYESDPLPETYELYEALQQGYMDVSNPAASGPITNQAATIPGEVLHQLHTPSESELRQPMVRAFPRPVFRLERQNRSPLVGRDQELTIMREHLFAAEDASQEEAQKDNSGGYVPFVKRSAGDLQRRQKKMHFLLLTGEAGIGKTRIAEELSLEANAQEWSVAWGHAYEQERAIPFRPWIEALGKMLQDTTLESLFSSDKLSFIAPPDDLTDTSHSASSMKAKPAKLSLFLPELAAYDTLAATHNASISPMPPTQERLHLWEATLALLNALSRETRILLVLDDLHWTDESSLELLAYLVRHLQDERILLVGTCRDDELTTNSNLRNLINDLRKEQCIVTLSLQPLTHSQIGSLVAHLPKDIVQNIQILASGNPFFAEELARVSETPHHSLEGSKGEIGLASQFHVSNEGVPPGITSDVTLSETIASVLERRLSKLSNDCLALLGKASVLGESFECSQLLLMAGDRGPKEDTMLELLEEALRAGLLTEERTGANITYYFKGLVYLQQTLDIFGGCGTTINRDRVGRILANLENQN